MCVRERTSAILSDRERTRERERERERDRAGKGRSARSSPHRRRDACVRLSIYYGGGGGTTGSRETGARRCACKRVKRRDIFYIYGYLPLLCSRAGGLRQRANRPPSFPSPSLLLSLLRHVGLLLHPVPASVLSVSPFPSRGVLSAGRASRRPDHVSSPVPSHIPFLP